MSAQSAFPFEFKRTLELVTGALFDAPATWRAWLPEAGDWRKTALILTLPTIVAAMFAAWVIGLFTSGLSLLGGTPTLSSTLLSIVGAAGAIAVATFIFSTLAGVFGGKRDFALGFAALSLALVPAYAGEALSSLPWIGSLAALFLAVFGLVQLWRIIPLYLGVPQDNRVKHYAVSLVATVVVMIVVSAVIGPDEGIRPTSTAFDSTSHIEDAAMPVGGGLFGGLTRRAELFTAAQEDRYEPAADGRLTEAQVRNYTRVMERFAERVAEEKARVEQLSERVEQSDHPALNDIAAMTRGIGDMSMLSTAEIEIVKSGGGNWAEHQWVRETLRTASLQKDSSDAVAHNYALYEKYQPELRGFYVR